jgi:hypothetical protein
MADVLSALERLSDLPELQPGASAQTVVTGPDAVAELLKPRPEPKSGGRQVRPGVTTLTALAQKRRYLVPALLGAVIGLLLLVAWLLRANLSGGPASLPEPPAERSLRAQRRFPPDAALPLSEASSPETWDEASQASQASGASQVPGEDDPLVPKSDPKRPRHRHHRVSPSVAPPLP